jgi:hypothetical protein
VWLLQNDVSVCHPSSLAFILYESHYFTTHKQKRYNTNYPIMSMKSYFRYEPSKVLGAISSPVCNATFDHSGNLIITGAAQDVVMFNARHGSRVGSVREETSQSYPYDFNTAGASEPTVLCTSQDGYTVFTGYSCGEIRSIDYHKSSITVSCAPINMSCLFRATQHK